MDFDRCLFVFGGRGKLWDGELKGDNNGNKSEYG